MSYDKDYKNLKAQDEYIYPNWVCAIGVWGVVGVFSTIVYLFN